MKKTIVLTILIAALALAACGRVSPAADAPQSSAPVQLANPWRELPEEEAKALCPKSFGVPEGAQNAVWSVLDSVADPSGVPGPLVQLSFDLYGNRFTAREQLTGDKADDISGMFYEWTARLEEALRLETGDELPCVSFRYIGEGGYADLCTWFDPAAGVSASVSVVAPDLDGFDLLAIAEALYR